MKIHISMQTHAENYLNERRGLGFILKSPGYSIKEFAHYVDSFDCKRPLTVEVMMDWARQDKWNSDNPLTWGRRLQNLRPFSRYLQQFEPETEILNKSVFGRINHRLAPHIYTENDIKNLLNAAHHLKPAGGLRSATYETLFGLLSSTGLRVSEAVNLLNNDVDLKHGMLTIRQTKFAKSRYVPLHPTAIKALRTYYLLRNSHIHTSGEASFFIGSRGAHLGQQLSLRVVRHTFASLRNQLNWINRGGHHAPRIHDLRHTFVVRRILLWYAQDVNIDQGMLSLSTYLGHSKVSDTYWYLTGVPELMAVAGKPFELFTQQQENHYV